MKKTPLFLLAASLLFGLSNSGCALFLIGAGAAGGYAVSQDEVEGLTDSTFDRVWNSSREIMRSKGALTAESKANGTMEAEVQGSTVEVRIEQVTPKTVRTRIKARKTNGLFPDIDLAQSLYSQIIRKVK